MIRYCIVNDLFDLLRSMLIGKNALFSEAISALTKKKKRADRASRRFGMNIALNSVMEEDAKSNTRFMILNGDDFEFQKEGL